MGICLEKRSPSGALPTASYIFTHVHAVIRPLFSPDNVRTRTRARGTVRPHFSYDNAHARASGVHLYHLRHIRAVTERIGSGYGADQSASLLYDREKSGEGERRRRLFFAPTTCAHNARARERRSTSHFYQRKSVAAHTFFRRLCAHYVCARDIDRICVNFFNRQRARVREASREFPPPFRAHVKQCRERERITGTTRGIISSRRGKPGLPFLVGYL